MRTVAPWTPSKWVFELYSDCFALIPLLPSLRPHLSPMRSNQIKLQQTQAEAAAQRILAEGKKAANILEVIVFCLVPSFLVG